MELLGLTIVKKSFYSLLLIRLGEAALENKQLRKTVSELELAYKLIKDEHEKEESKRGKGRK